MTEQELRTLVREAIARHAAGMASSAAGHAGPAASMTDVGRVFSAPASHASHGMLVVPSGADADGPCIIEPAVICNHCGYCKSMGH